MRNEARKVELQLAILKAQNDSQVQQAKIQIRDPANMNPNNLQEDVMAHEDSMRHINVELAEIQHERGSFQTKIDSEMLHGGDARLINELATIQIATIFNPTNEATARNLSKILDFLSKIQNLTESEILDYSILTRLHSTASIVLRLCQSRISLHKALCPKLSAHNKANNSQVLHSLRRIRRLEHVDNTSCPEILVSGTFDLSVSHSRAKIGACKKERVDFASSNKVVCKHAFARSAR